MFYFLHFIFCPFSRFSFKSIAKLIMMHWLCLCSHIFDHHANLINLLQSSVSDSHQRVKSLPFPLKHNPKMKLIWRLSCPLTLLIIMMLITGESSATSGPEPQKIICFLPVTQDCKVFSRWLWESCWFEGRQLMISSQTLSADLVSTLSAPHGLHVFVSWGAQTQSVQVRITG